jgi:hypothetical protein
MATAPTLLTKVYVGVSAATFTPTGQTAVDLSPGIQSVEKTMGGTALRHVNGAHKWNQWTDEVNISEEVRVNVETFAQSRIGAAFVRGTVGVLAWTGKQRNTNGTSLKDKNYTASYARFLRIDKTSIGQEQKASCTMVFQVWSSDGDTDPITAADAT